ncbi:unnamed protein product [Cyprideis torosa]|uniref:Zinc finger double-stranded RNA binding domain-containing protein n=1 Tax=Cyprideis torosa TaxID=163714 RepID=A0A7R8WJ63_9CRUS|nr:unnamed protein product [Cyprideis torosa]CAG0901549.1 unnamed protein product [Cyprideis torosa]
MGLVGSRSRNPLIIVMGATGTGKSKLGIDLAHHFGGEVISADSMQVYRGLDIVTAKVTQEEMKGVTHHLLGYLDPLEEPIVSDFRNQALPLIHRMKNSGTLPIVVGGTNYYIESILWRVLVGVSRDEQIDSFYRKFDSTPVEELYAVLKERDPERAQTLHPRDRRKILRSLSILETSNLTHTEVIERQRSEEGGNQFGGGLRFKDACIFWMQCDPDVLDLRLDQRVDQMMSNGLLKELQDFHLQYNRERLAHSGEADYTHGIFQTIGFKEFHEYLMLDEHRKKTKKGKDLLVKSIKTMKFNTRKYARHQLKWIRSRFLRPGRPAPPIFALDATDPDKWEERVLKPAVQVVQALIEGKDLPLTPVGPTGSPEVERQVMYCEICDVHMVGKSTLQVHLNSRRHKKRVLGIKRRELLATLGYIENLKRNGASKTETAEDSESDSDEVSMKFRL